MSPTAVSTGFIPLAVAQERGLAAEEGIALELRRAPPWSSLRDMLSFGMGDAAHMPVPVPVATALGLGGLLLPCKAIWAFAPEKVRAVRRDWAWDEGAPPGG